MNANEARKVAETKKLSLFQKQYNEIMRSIERYAEAERYEVSYHEKLREDVQEHLVELGYKVWYKQSGMNEFETIISW